MSIVQYFKDTRGELRHVAWPTRTQTIIYTVLVAILSIVVSLYLGLFDYIFTGSLSRVLQATPGTSIESSFDGTNPLLEISTSSSPASTGTSTQ